jgi:hypothetical protein
MRRFGPVRGNSAPRPSNRTTFSAPSVEFRGLFQNERESSSVGAHKPKSKIDLAGARACWREACLTFVGQVVNMPPSATLLQQLQQKFSGSHASRHACLVGRIEESRLSC